MPLYRATNKQTREVVEYNEPTPRAEHLVEPWRCERLEYGSTPGQVTPQPTVYGDRRELTRLEFMRLFTQAERVAIKDFTAGTTAQAKAVRDFMYMMELAGTISLDDDDTVTGLNFLENRSLIAAGRAEEILRG